MANSFTTPQLSPLLDDDAVDTDKRIIDCTRVICIFFMMYTHIEQYEGSIIYEGKLKVIGIAFIDFLGRASVPALSLISGYLLTSSMSKKSALPLKNFVNKKSYTVLMPAFIWNIFYILMIFSAYLFLDRSHRIIDDFQNRSILEIVNVFSGLTASPANFSLYFIRDLFVCQILLFVTIKWGGRVKVILLIGLAIYFSIWEMNPIIEREMIALFIILGSLLSISGMKIETLVSSAALQTASLFVLAAFVWKGVGGIADAISWDIAQLLIRITMTILILSTAYFLSKFSFSRVFERYAKISFLSYLLHLPIMTVAWVMLNKIVGGNDGWPYVLYFLIAPVTAWIAAIVLQNALRYRPTLGIMLGLKG